MQFFFQKKSSAKQQLEVFLNKLFKLYENVTHDELTVLRLDSSNPLLRFPRNFCWKRFNHLAQANTCSNFLRPISPTDFNLSKSMIICPQTVTNGVPQESLLVPLLFLLYVNDLPETILRAHSYGYADDYTQISIINRDSMTIQMH